MRSEKEEKKQKFKMYLILYGLLWFMGLIVVSAMAWQEKEGNATIFTAMEAVGRMQIFSWLHPSTWGACLKWTAIYWIGISMFLVYEQKFRHDAAGIEAGSAHWNDAVEEFNKTHNEPFDDKLFAEEPNRPHEAVDDGWQEGLMNQNNPERKESKPVPGNPNMVMSATVRLSTADMVTHLNLNVFLVGGAGTGKSRFFIKPNILQMNCSYIVTDPSGELLKSMHNVLAENDYVIKVFNLVDMSRSCLYNPFKYIQGDTDVGILIDCFMSNTTSPDQRSGIDPFWDKSEKAVLSAAIFYLIEIADPCFRTFSTILWMIQTAQMDENASKPLRSTKPAFGFSVNMTLDHFFNGTKKIAKKSVKGKDGKTRVVLEAVDTNETETKQLQGKLETSLALANYKTFRLAPVRTLMSIVISAASRLNPFNFPEVRELTHADNVELDAVGDRLTCFFVILPQTNDTYNFLASMLFSQMFETLYRKGASMHDPSDRLNYHVRFLLDEFSNIGKIPQFPQKISTCRKYNISATIVLQSIAQIKMLYQDEYETIIANCDTSICLGTNEQTTADYFSKKLGKTTITARNKSTQVGKNGGTLSFNQTGRELMTPDEIMTMPFDECIVMINHTKPFYDKKYPLEKHPQFQYTGDASKDNIYLLENDPEFLCKNNTEEIAEHAAGVEGTRSEDAQYQPRTLREVLGDLLENDPGEDGYFLVRDASQVKSSLYDSAVKEKIWEAVESCADREYQTVFYDGGDIDPFIVEPMLNMVMNDSTAPVEGFIMAYETISGTGYALKAAAKNNHKNVAGIFGQLRIKYGKEDGNRYGIYRPEGTVDAPTLGKIEEGCKKGSAALAPDTVDAAFEDYMYS